MIVLISPDVNRKSNENSVHSFVRDEIAYAKWCARDYDE